MLETNLTLMENFTVQHLPFTINGTINGTPVNLMMYGNWTVEIAQFPYSEILFELLLVIAILNVFIVFLLIVILLRKRKVVF